MPPETTEQSQEYAYKAEMKQLLHLIVHSLYTHPEVFLRELISNASDALNKARFFELTGDGATDPSVEPRITITPDAEAKTLTIEDTGIGMTHDDLVARIGTVASSGTLDFIEQQRQSGKPLDANLIGQFGVGFYSAFMVADEIVVETRHAAPGSAAYRWRSRGEGTYTIEPAERATRGATITLHLKPDAEEFAQEYRLKQIVRKYSNFVDFPIYIGGEQVNTVKALWQKSRAEVTDEERQAFYTFLTGDPAEPLGHLHLSLEGRVNFRALLFVPATAPPGLFREDFRRNLHLYANNVFIQDDADELLPEYLRFVRGVVDSEDLPLNVSREVTQASPAMARMRTALTGRVLDLLEEWARADAEKYTAFFEQYGALFKLGLGADFTNRERLLELLRFPSSRTPEGAYTSLAAYAAAMPADQPDIYYVLADHREAAERLPALEYFKQRNLEVLYLLDPVDAFILPYLGTYQDKTLKSIEQADLKLEEPAQEALPEAQRTALLARFKAVLGDAVADVTASPRLVQSAATLVVPGGGLDPHLERMMKAFGQEAPVSKKVLEVNLGHPLMQQLAARLDAPEAPVDDVIRQVHEGAQLLDGSLAQPAAYVERMTDLLVRLTRA